MGRLSLAAFVLAAALVQMLAALPGFTTIVGLLIASIFAMAAAIWQRARLRTWRIKILVWPLLAFMFGASLAMFRADLRLADALDPELEGGSIPAVFRIASLSTIGQQGQRAEVDILESRAGMPSRIQLAWFGDTRRQETWAPGQRWQGYLVPKRPHGGINPHGFDYEALLFERGVRATASIRNTPVLLDDDPYATPLIAIQRLRHYLRGTMQQTLGDTRYGAVLIALAMGDQAGIARNDWVVFNRTGITHLVSISGMHVTMLAAMAGLAVLRVWSRARWRGVALAEYSPAQVIAAGAALFTALLYCLLAGWGVPAQRTFFMLAVLAVAAIARLPLSGSRVLVLAAACVVALDPWASLSPGFWLSFGAVAVLMMAGSGRWRLAKPGEKPARLSRWQRWRRGFIAACQLQLAITIGLVPLLALIFQQISLVSPLANAIAIPVVSFIVTPLALLVMLLSAIPGLETLAGWIGFVAHEAFAWSMRPIEAMSNWPGSNFAVAAVPWPWIAVAMFGIVWSLQPRGLPGRMLALLLVLPVLVFRPERPAHGEWRMTMLDVGQGGGVVIETAEQTVVFDAGPRYSDDADAGDRVVWPYLRARGVTRIDQLIVSHGDADHAGGLASLLNALPVDTLRAPSSMAGQVDAARPADRATPPLTPCVAGQVWETGGLTFTMLAPLPTMVGAKDKNAGGCVLFMQGRTHNAMLMGDVGIAQEAALLAEPSWPGPVDVVVAGHHGSHTSSGQAFVDATQAVHAIMQAGYLNRYRHPNQRVLKRWEQSGAVVHRSDHHGAIIVESVKGQLGAVRARDAQRRYWHTSAAS
ncbi:DNA internalization-related competence protein ComEC/Rec2 [Pigmentiphaga aceris]|uniref:DNA internalization-related competence protein ComEC/Rec2 n=1 Tax=Pigmentiphaga aceris TaxID=1940612 RepID=A0A5C0AZZ9_9BURK|nr:DNA internalization-related competence protein ComEC/Rec2 [Pigmentiphaga aceris]QEI05937.1 DNA internalization-related competence protein ComEC/Rec2 [Pigmentiphaga aceris]